MLKCILIVCGYIQEKFTRKGGKKGKHIIFLWFMPLEIYEKGVKHFEKHKVGDGARIFFWFNEWCSEGPRHTIFPVVFSLVSNQQAAVSEVLCRVNGMVLWNVIFCRNA